MNVDEAADHLYGLPLDEFVAKRDELAKQAKADGAPDAAKQIKALRKPTVAAWIANQLVRAERSSVEELVALGDQMRTATAASDGATLRTLTAERKQAVTDLVAAAREVAEQSDQRVTDEVKDLLNTTLLAAVAGPQAGLELLTGRLEKPLEHSGFGPLPLGEPAQVVSLTAARANKTKPAKKVAAEPAKKAAAERSTDLQAELKAAEAELEVAETKVADLRSVHRDRRDEVDAALETVDRLEAELVAARKALEKAEVAAERAEDDLDAARREVEAATRKRRAARLAR